MRILLAVVLMGITAAHAHELDQDFVNQYPTQDQIEKAKDLPKTVVIRIDRTDESKVAVAHLKEELAPGQSAENLNFEQVALNAEVNGLAFDSSNELDLTTSTASWRFGFGGWPGYGYNNYGYNNYYPSYGYNSWGGFKKWGGWANWGYRPYYDYGGYNYYYKPYYFYRTPSFVFLFCKWWW